MSPQRSFRRISRISGLISPNIPRRDWKAGLAMHKIMMVVGTRPDIIRMTPLFYEFKKYPNQFEISIMHTGQHSDENMSQIFFDQFKLPRPDYNLEAGYGTQALQTGTIMVKAEEILMRQRPNMLIVFGDVNSSLALALTAAKMNIPITHIEAGLRDKDRSTPQEINRTVIDLVADNFFTSCDQANLSLIKEGRDIEKVFLVGSLYADMVKHFLPETHTLKTLEQMGLEEKKYILLTFHKPCNLDNPERLKRLMEIVSTIADKTRIVLPLHPRTRDKLLSDDLGSLILNNMNIKLTEPLGYPDFLKLQNDAALVITDSGGVQEETTCLGVTCLTLRDKTERMATVTDGSNMLVDLKLDKILSQIDFCMQNNQPPKRKPFLWDGQTAERIVKNLRNNIEFESSGLYQGETQIPSGKATVTVLI